jgi:hypothetical protein
MKIVRGVRGALLLVLAHFFEHGRWASPVQIGAEGQSLTAKDQLSILMQAGQHLTAIRGSGASEAGLCYERAESLAHSLNCPTTLQLALVGVAPFPDDGQAECNVADCQTPLHAGAGAE